MKIKLICFALLICLLPFNIVVFAIDSNTITVQVMPGNTPDTVIINGTLSVAEARPVTIQIVKPGGIFGRVEDAYHFDEVITGVDGKFSLNMDMSKVTSGGGLYTVYAGGRGLSVYTQTFNFYSREEQKAMIALLDAAASADQIGTMLSDQYYRAVADSNGFLLSGYDTLPGSFKADVCSVMFTSSLTIANAANIFNTNIALATMNAMYVNDNRTDDPYDVLLQNAQILGLPVGTGSVVEWLGKDAVDGSLVKILEGKKYSSPDLLLKAFNETTIVDAFNKALWIDMEHLLKISNYYLQCDLSYDGVSDQKPAIFKKMVRTYQNSGQIKSALEDAENDVKTDKGTTGSSSIRGSKGNTGGSSTMTYQKIDNTPEPAPAVTSGTSEKGFSDLENVAWAKDSVAFLAGKGIVSGDAQGLYNPNRNVSREEFIKMLVVAFHVYDNEAECNFTDVPENEWYYSYVASAEKSGIVKGTTDEFFGVGQEVSRQDMAELMNRVLKQKGIALPSVREEISFIDNGEIAEYASDSVKLLYRAGIINGMSDGSFAPLEPATRAQAAKVLSDVIKIVEPINN